MILGLKVLLVTRGLKVLLVILGLKVRLELLELLALPFSHFQLI